MSQIEHPEMVRVLAKSGDVIASEMSGFEAHLLHMAVGISGEAAELMDAYATSTEFNKPLDIVNILEELGDLEFYIEGFRQGLEIDRVAVRANEGEPYQSNHTHENAWMCVILNIAAGELLDLTKKMVIYKKTIEITEFTRILGKIDRILGHIRTCHDFTLSDVLDANIAKLGKRYEGFKYSDSAAQTRADKAE